MNLKKLEKEILKQFKNLRILWGGGDGRKSIARGCEKPVIRASFMLTKLARLKEFFKGKRVEENELIEVLADLEHEQWSAWARHFLDRVYYQNPPDEKAIRRWERQIDTPYEKLSEKEKEKDREWAWKMLKKLLLVGDRKGNIWVNTDRPVNKKLLRKIIELIDRLLQEVKNE